MDSGKTKSGFNAFETLLLRNAARVRGLDSAMTYLLPFLPSQTPSTALGSEAAASVTVLLNIYLDQVVSRLTPPQEKSLDSKFLDAVYGRSKKYCALAYVLSIVKSSELFLEMAAQHYRGRKGQWNTVLGVESIKAALRLGMLGLSKRPLPSNVPVHEASLSTAELDELVNQTRKPSHSTRSGKTLPEKLTPDTRSELKRPNMDQLKPPIELVHRLGWQRTIAEIVHILRPLIYALLVHKYRAKRRSWTPWLIGISIEFVARQLARQAQKSNPYQKPSSLEQQVLSNRDKDFVWWLMRGAMYLSVSRPVLDKISLAIMKMPLVKIAGVLMQDWMFLFDEYYFGAATM